MNLKILALIVAVVSAQCTQRRAWQSLQASEKRAYVEAVRNMKKSGQYDKFVQLHLSHSAATHSTDMFLVWHRAYIHDFEQALGVPLPYWDWSADSQAPHLSDIFTDAYFGGSGTGANNCVTNGQFKDWVDTAGRKGCLQRCFDGGNRINPYSPPEFNAAFTSTSTSYSEFRVTLEGTVHAQIHNSMGAACGGDMAQMYSPNDPVFFLHHANVDRIWARWQKSCSTYGTDYPGSHSQQLVGMSWTAGDALVGGRLCQNYAPAPSEVTLVPQCPPGSAVGVTAGDAAAVPPPAVPVSGSNTTSVKATSWSNANVNNADDSWLINSLKGLSHGKSQNKVARRADGNVTEAVNVNATDIATNLTVTLPSVNITANNVTVNVTINANGTNNTTNFTAPVVEIAAFKPTLFKNFVKFNRKKNNGTFPAYKPLPEVKIKAPSYTDRDPKLLRLPTRVSEKYLKMMNYDVVQVRALETYMFHVIDAINQKKDYISPGCLSAQYKRLGDIGYKVKELDDRYDPVSDLKPVKKCRAKKN